MWPAFPRRPLSSFPSSTMPPPTPVDTTMAMKSAQPDAAPTQPSPSANALASLSTKVGSPVKAARRDRRGKDRHPAMFNGDTSSPPGLIGPPQPVPQTTSRSPAPTRPATPSTRPARWSHSTSASAGLEVAGVGRVARSRREPSRATRPAAILVPPMSTASARSATEGLLPRYRDGSRYACLRTLPVRRRAAPRSVLAPVEA